MVDDIQVVFEKKSSGKAEVSVIITLYNYEIFVIETLNSLLSQTLKEFDLVIIDDHSTDNSLSVARNWIVEHQSRFNQIKLLFHKQNKGLGKSRNAAFKFTETAYVFVLDADNLIYPFALEKLLKGLKNSNADFAFSILEHFGDSKRLGGIQPWRPETLVYGNTIDAMVLMKKETWEKVGGYAEDMPCNGWEDYELWFKLAEIGGWGVRIPEILCRYRVHANSMLRVETNKKAEELLKYLRNKYKKFNFK